MHLNDDTRELVLKIVYYGPGMSGKTTNLTSLHDQLPKERIGQLESVTTEGDRTLFFDYLPLDVGKIQGHRVSFQLFTVPGQPKYRSTRKMVLQGADGIVFVANSAPDSQAYNEEILEDLYRNLVELGRSPRSVPMVFQYNKRDLGNKIDLTALNAALNSSGRPYIEAEAAKGIGTVKTLETICAETLRKISKSVLGMSRPKEHQKESGSTTRIGTAVKRRSEIGIRANSIPPKQAQPDSRPPAAQPNPASSKATAAISTAATGGTYIAGVELREAVRLVPKPLLMFMLVFLALAVVGALAIYYA